MIYHLEKEREKFGAEASDANAKFGAVVEEVKLGMSSLNQIN